MKHLKNLEIILLNTVNGELVATISYQDLSDEPSLNNGYNHITIPVNLRPLRLSAYDNVLVDQSVREEGHDQAKANS